MTTVNRRKFLKAAGAGGVAAAATTIAAPAIAQTNPEVKWRMQASWPKSLDTLYGGVELICKRVGELTDGKFQIQPFAAGEIVGGLQVLDAVQNNTVECGHTALYYYFGKDDTFVFGSALPFGMNSRMQHAWLYHGGGIDLLNEFLKDYNCDRFPRRPDQLPDGRLVPQATQDRRRLEGRQDAARRLCRQDRHPRRHGAATDRRRRHLSVAGKGHHRRRRVGRSLRRRKARLRQGREVLPLSRLVGAELEQHRASSISRSGTHCRRTIKSPCRRHAPKRRCG